MSEPTEREFLEGLRPEDEQVAANTDRELWREGGGDGNGMSYYEPSIHVTEQGGIGINVGGNVYVKTLREWHGLAAQLTAQAERLRERDEQLRDETHNRASAARAAQRYRNLAKDATEYLDALGKNEMADKYRAALSDGKSQAVYAAVPIAPNPGHDGMNALGDKPWHSPPEAGPSEDPFDRGGQVTHVHRPEPGSQ